MYAYNTIKSSILLMLNEVDINTSTYTCIHTHTHIHTQWWDLYPVFMWWMKTIYLIFSFFTRNRLLCVCVNVIVCLSWTTLLNHQHCILQSLKIKHRTVSHGGKEEQASKVCKNRLKYATRYQKLNKTPFVLVAFVFFFLNFHFTCK